MKVRIKSLGLPKAAYGQQANYGLSLSSPNSASSIQSAEHMMKPGLKPKRTIGGVPREDANLEAEGGESVVGQISGDGIVDHMTIKGPRHSSGGVPLSLPDDSFIFSDTASMKIKDPKILQMFGKAKGSYTPAELAKPYDISKYKAILMDPDTDRLSRTTAEIMIKNIVMKLGALALAQEAKKGFPQGIPEIAKPYMQANGISEEDLIPELRAQAEQMQAMQQQAMQMQQAQGMQQPQMQQQGPPQGMPQMMPDGQPVAMPQQPMMDPRQMMAMQQEQQMMPPQPQQGMPMAQEGIQSEIEFSKRDTRRMSKGKPVNMLKYPTKYTQKHDSDVYGVREINTTTDNGALDRNTMGTFVVDNTFPDGTGNTQYSGSQDGKRYTYNTDNNFAYYDGQKVDRRPDLEEAIGGMAGYVSNQRFGGTPMAAYGMQLGGFDMPFIMGNGGMPRYDGGGETVTLPDGRVVPATSAEALTYKNKGVKTSGGKKAAWEETITPGQTADAADAANTTRMASGAAEAAAWKEGLCNSMKPGGSRHGMNPKDVAKEHAPADYENMLAYLIDCQGNSEKFEDTSTVVAQYITPVEDVTEGTCGCPDPEGGTNEDGTPKLINVQTKAALGIPEDQPCDDEYCEETTEITDERKLDNEIAPLPVIPAVSFNRGVADPNKPALDIVGGLDGDYLDYRTAVQNDQGALEKQIASIKTMPGVSVGQKQAMIAQVQSQSKAPSLVTDVYNKNVDNSNRIKQIEYQGAIEQQQLQAGIDGQYNQALTAAENQETMNINAAKQYKVENAKDNMRMAMMSQSINNTSENFDALGNFIGGTQLSADQMCFQCMQKTGDVAACARWCPTTPETEAPAQQNVPAQNAPAPVAPAAKYGRIVNPYIMASSVYPWSK